MNIHFQKNICIFIELYINQNVINWKKNNSLLAILVSVPPFPTITIPLSISESFFGYYSKNFNRATAVLNQLFPSGRSNLDKWISTNDIIILWIVFIHLCPQLNKRSNCSSVDLNIIRKKELIFVKITSSYIFFSLSWKLE